MVIKKPCKKASLAVFAFVRAKGCTLIILPVARFHYYEKSLPFIKINTPDVSTNVRDKKSDSWT